MLQSSNALQPLLTTSLLEIPRFSQHAEVQQSCLVNLFQNGESDACRGVYFSHSSADILKNLILPQQNLSEHFSTRNGPTSTQHCMLRFKVFTVMGITMEVLWGVAEGSLVDTNQNFREV